MLPINLIPGAINELIATVTDTQRLTKASPTGNRYGMMAAVLDDSLADEERRSLVKGRIQVSEELSLA